MASNRPAPEAPSAYPLDDRGAYGGPGEADMYPDGPGEEWNPSEESLRPVRGKHRVGKQRSGGLARSGTVLGVGVIAAVGAGGMASAEGRPPVPVSMPDVGGVAHEIADSVGGLLSDSDSDAGSQATHTDGAGKGGDAGEALRSRILQQADARQSAADEKARDAAEGAVIKQAASKAAAAQQTAQKAADKAAAARKAAALEAKRKAEEAARRKAEEAARQKAEAERLARLARSYITPVASYTLTASFGQAGDRWAADHTGQDFAAPTGTPVRAVHGGTITQAGWAGSYGYRIVLTLDDGTELWFCHLSSMLKTSGKVSTGDVIARVGATGNVTGPHLHLEVRPGAGNPIDPMPWLREHGLNV